MSGYFHPVIVSVVCLNEVHEIGSVSHDKDLATFVYTLEHLLLSTHDMGRMWDEIPTLHGNDGEDNSGGGNREVLGAVRKFQLAAPASQGNRAGLR